MSGIYGRSLKFLYSSIAKRIKAIDIRAEFFLNIIDFQEILIFWGYTIRKIDSVMHAYRHISELEIHRSLQKKNFSNQLYNICTVLSIDYLKSCELNGFFFTYKTNKTSYQDQILMFGYFIHFPRIQNKVLLG